MRITLTVFGGLVAAALVGCGPAASTPNPATTTGPAKLGDGGLLKGKIAGRWEKDGNTWYVFNANNTYEHRDGDVHVKDGKWSAYDDKTVELTFTLTKEQADKMKPLAKPINDGIDAVNKLGEAAAKVAGSKYEPIKPVPEPKEGANTWRLPAEVTGDTLKLGGSDYKKKAA